MSHFTELNEYLDVGDITAIPCRWIYFVHSYGFIFAMEFPYLEHRELRLPARRVVIVL